MAAKLVMLKGLPGSGKSTFAKRLVASGDGNGPDAIVRVNKDDIRTELTKSGWIWSPKNEKDVLNIRDARIRTALRCGQTVISDDCNLAPKHEQALRAIAKACKVEFVVNDEFLKVHPGECIARDATRPERERVGEKVIMDMYTQYLAPRGPITPQVVVPDPSLPSAIICDLDGTLAIHNGRSPFEYDKCDTDLLNEPIYKILVAAEAMYAEPIFMSGREDSCREKTQAWLKTHYLDGFPLYMRKTGDFRKDSIVKSELFDAHIRGKFNVLFCLDDRDQIVKLWRDMGLTCLQVAYGNF